MEQDCIMLWISYDTCNVIHSQRLFSELQFWILEEEGLSELTVYIFLEYAQLIDTQGFPEAYIIM